MDIDELLFGTVSKYFKKRNKKKILLDNNAVFLKDVKPRLTILGRAITGNPIEIFPAEREGGYKNNNFFLPIYFNELSTKEKNLGLYFFRILFLSVQSDLNINLIADEVFPEEKNQQILTLLFQKYPNAEEIYEELKIHFENCYGIKKLQHTFDFTKSKVQIIYAPNGAMKSSFAKTLDDSS